MALNPRTVQNLKESAVRAVYLQVTQPKDGDKVNAPDFKPKPDDFTSQFPYSLAKQMAIDGGFIDRFTKDKTELSMNKAAESRDRNQLGKSAFEAKRRQVIQRIVTDLRRQYNVIGDAISEEAHAAAAKKRFEITRKRRQKQGKMSKSSTRGRSRSRSSRSGSSRSRSRGSSHMTSPGTPAAAVASAAAPVAAAATSGKPMTASEIEEFQKKLHENLMVDEEEW